MKRKILILLPSLGGGGTERVLLNFFEKADRSRFDITLAVVILNGIYKNAIPEGINLIHLFSLPFAERIFSYIHKRLGVSLPYRWAIHKKIKGPYDIAISYQDSNYTELLFLLKNVGKRISWVHSAVKTNPNYQKYLGNKKYLERLKQNRYRKIDEVVFVSDTVRDNFLDLFDYKGRYRVIHNILNKESVIQKSLAVNPIEKDRFLFAALGNLLAVKGYDLLIEAAALLKARNIHFEICIIGEGPERLKLEAMIDKNKLNDYFRLTGYVSNPYPILKAADAFIMTSVSEAMPTALCEAFILGKPSLAVRCEACVEFSANGKYALIAERNAEDLAGKMEQFATSRELLELYSLRSAERGKLFDDKIVLNEYYSILNS